MLFEWDDEKEQKNIVKHGLDFSTAVRIISARAATKTERRMYYDNSQGN